MASSLKIDSETISNSPGTFHLSYQEFHYVKSLLSNENIRKGILIMFFKKSDPILNEVERINKVLYTKIPKDIAIMFKTEEAKDAFKKGYKAIKDELERQFSSQKKK